MKAWKRFRPNIFIFIDIYIRYRELKAQSRTVLILPKSARGGSAPEERGKI